MKNLIKVLSLVTIVTFVSCMGSYEEQAKKEMNKIENQVALDAERQYEIAKKNGSDMDAYVHAGMVAAAYLQAEDEENYKKWKEIEKKAGKKVGL